MSCELQGELDIEAFTRAWTAGPIALGGTVTDDGLPEPPGAVMVENLVIISGKYPDQDDRGR